MNLEKLKKEQIKLAKKVKIKDDFEKIELIAGCDQAFKEKDVFSVVVVLDKDMKEIEKADAQVKAPIPYISGFLSYREAPAVVEAFTKLNQKPDLLMVDANGILHPRRIGMASHLGILLDVPTIGVAKNPYVGEVKGDKIYYNDKLRGVLVKTKTGSKPLYISPGHRISLKTAVEIVKKCLKDPHKLPEPLHLAHRYVKELVK